MNGYGKRLYALAKKLNIRLRMPTAAEVARTVIVMLSGTAAWKQEQAKSGGWCWTIGCGILLALMITDKESTE